MAGCASVRPTCFIITGIHSKSVRRECALRWPQSLDSNFDNFISCWPHGNARFCCWRLYQLKDFLWPSTWPSVSPSRPLTRIKTNEIVVNWGLIKFQADSAAILKRSLKSESGMRAMSCKSENREVNYKAKFLHKFLKSFGFMNETKLINLSLLA